MYGAWEYLPVSGTGNLSFILIFRFLLNFKSF